MEAVLAQAESELKESIYSFSEFDTYMCTLDNTLDTEFKILGTLYNTGNYKDGDKED